MYFERLTKYERFKYLLKQLDGSGLLDIIRQVVSQTLASYHERTLCVCGCKREQACVLACVFVCMRICVCVCVYMSVHAFKFVYVCARGFVFHNSQDSNILNNKVLFPYKYI